MKHPSPKPSFEGSVFDRPDRSRTRARLLAAIPIAACHVALFAFVSSSTPGFTPEPLPEPPVMAELSQPPPPPAPQPVEKPEPSEKAAATPAAAAPPKPEKPAPPKMVVQARPARTPPPEVQPLPAAPAGPSEPNVVLGDAALAGATVAGSGAGSGCAGAGSGGGQCDMVRRLQDALRGDPEVRAAVARSHSAIAPRGKAILVWNGEWLRSPGQDGKGLAGVRQAIAMEVAFAPPACKAQSMRGLVVISFNDSPTAPKLALGSREWRWSELLSARR